MADTGQKLLRAKILVTRFWLAIETWWPALWPAIAILGFFMAISLFDPWAGMLPWIRSLLLIAVLIASGLVAFRSIRGLATPGKKNARRRLEANSGLSHRPLDQVDDGVAGKRDNPPEPRTHALWQAHKQRSSVSPHILKVGSAHAGLQYRDPFAIRTLLVLLIFVGFANAGTDWSRRIEAAFTIDLAASHADVRLDAWLTPPGYTGVGAVTLAMAGVTGEEFGGIPSTGARSASSFTVPEGTALSVRIDGTLRQPRLSIGSTEVELTASENTTGQSDVYAIEKILLDSGNIEIAAGNLSRAWRVSIVPDQAPSVTFAETPDATNRHALRVRYTLNDDYGVEEATLDISNPAGSETDAITISVAGADTRADIRADTREEAVSRTTYQDLTAHPWAGMPVKGQLIAADALGQTAQSEKIDFVLPERPFTHPVARKLITVRKMLFRVPEKREVHARRLERLSRQPSAFDGDLAVFTALRTAFWRLRWNEDARSLREVTSLLWDTAMHLEEGEVSVVETALRNLLEDAQRALSDDQSGADFGAMADQIAQLMRDYLAAQMERAESGQLRQMDAGEMQSIGGDMLSRMLQQMKDLAAAGRTEEAMALLSELRAMLENASPRQMDAEAYKRLMEGARALDAMEGIAREQQALLERTSRERMLSSAREQLGSDAPSALPQMSKAQEALAQRLGELTDKLKKDGPGAADQVAPDQLEKAGQEMNKAADALQNGDGEAAQTAQQAALNALREAINKLGTQLSQQLVQLRQTSPAGDPLGRPTDAARERIDIPDQTDMEEARRLLLELRDRLSDPSRDMEEIEYLRRLLRRF